MGRGKLNSFKLRKEFVDFLERAGYINSEEIKRAFLEIPREVFSTYDSSLSDIYSDNVIVTYIKNGKVISTSSQPSLMAKMIEMLDIKKGDSVLEIGTGTGYNAAIISRIVGDEGKVLTVEVQKELCEIARENFKKLGLKNIMVINSDGSPEILRDFSPFDSILVTVGIDFPKKDFSLLVKPGGKICFPLNFYTIDINPTCLLKRTFEDFLFSIEIASKFLRAKGKLAWRNDIFEKIDIDEILNLKPLSRLKIEEFYNRDFIIFLETVTLSLYQKSGFIIYFEENEENKNIALFSRVDAKFYSNKILKNIMKILSLWKDLKKPSVFNLTFKVSYSSEKPKIEPKTY